MYMSHLCIVHSELGQAEMVELLLARGCHAGQRDSRGQLPVDLALRLTQAEPSHKKCVTLCYKSMADNMQATFEARYSISRTRRTKHV